MTDDQTPRVADGPGDPGWPERLERLNAAEVSPRRAELRRLAEAARKVLHGLVLTDAEDEELREAADRLEDVSALFESTPTRSIYEVAESANSGDPHGFFDHSPMTGRANPLAPPLTLGPNGDRAVAGTAVFGAAYEGPPGYVHGGYVAAAFDEVLGAAQSLSGQPGMTARLSVDYRSPTPLHEELRFVGTFERTEGRKTFTTGTLHAGDQLCAEAQGLFVAIDFGRFEEMKQARESQRTGRSSLDR